MDREEEKGKKRGEDSPFNSQLIFYVLRKRKKKLKLSRAEKGKGEKKKGEKTPAAPHDSSLHMEKRKEPAKAEKEGCARYTPF